MRFEIFQGKNGQWYWRGRARNGEITCQSEGYTRKRDAKRAIGRFLETAYYAHGDFRRAPHLLVVEK